jgi:hypothetical protein
MSVPLGWIAYAWPLAASICAAEATSSPYLRSPNVSIRSACILQRVLWLEQGYRKALERADMHEGAGIGERGWTLGEVDCEVANARYVDHSLCRLEAVYVYPPRVD